MTKRTVTTDYDAPLDYERLIAPRYEPIARALVHAAKLSRARRALGEPSFPSAAPGRAVRRVESAGFRDVVRRDFELAPRFESVYDYLVYRRGFGVPVIWTRAQYERVIAALRKEAAQRAAPDGSLTLGWMVTLITARRRSERI